MIGGDQGRYANAANLLSQCQRFLLSKDQASDILNTMEEQIKTTWHSVARSVGVSESDCQMISNAFAYPGFRRL